MTSFNKYCLSFLGIAGLFTVCASVVFTTSVVNLSQSDMADFT